jgi:PAS domain S-box-containing protein
MSAPLLPILDFFATDDAVVLLEASLAAAKGPERGPAMIALAWQMRQRDTRKAMALADEAQTSLDTSPSVSTRLVDEFARRRLQARLMLIRGEAEFLSGELDASAVLAANALQDFAACFDAIGCADAHWLQYLIASGQGDAVRQEAELGAAAAAAQSHDPVRVTVAHAALAFRAVYQDVGAAQKKWAARFAGGTADMHPAAASWVNGFFAAVAGQSSKHVESIRHYGITYTQALTTGQVRRAVVAATNLGVGFNNLNDHHAALEWMQRGLDLARPYGWPGAMGVALLQTAGTLRELQRFDAARALLHEAMALMAQQSASRNYAVALRYLADVDLGCHHYTDALASFQLLAQRANALGAADMLCNALRGQARALLELEQPQAALAKAHAALGAARSDAIHQIDALRVLADIHARHALPPPPGMVATSAPLHYLQQALEAAATMEDYTVPGDLLEVVAQAYANVGDTARAFELAKQAIAAREVTHSREASNRAVAMQITHETQRARAEELHQRQLAEAHAGRADLLEQANEAYHAVLENAQDAIVLTDSQGRIHNWNQQAVRSFGWTLDEALGQDILAMLFPARFRDEVSATIARQQTAQKNTPRLETLATRRDGTEFPIELSVTSMRVRGQFECSFFVRDITQRVQAGLEIAESLARQRELADLKSRFVSMASHEFRTPLATILSSSDVLKLYGARMADAERESCFAFISDAVQRMKNMLEDVLLIGVTEAGASQFKPSAHALGPLCESIVEEVQRGLADQPATTAQPIAMRIADRLCLVDLDERWFRHIFGNLLSNAIKYSPEGGEVHFGATVHAKEVEFQVVDRGIGLPEQDIPRLFETFFRASNSGKIPGTGLGLSIVQRAVELHGGRISVASELGQGTTFTVVLPLRQPLLIHTNLLSIE